MRLHGKGGLAPLGGAAMDEWKSARTMAGGLLDAATGRRVPPSLEVVPAQSGDRLLMLPSGTVLFNSLPRAAIVLDAIVSVINDGIVTSRRGDAAGVALIRGGRIVERFYIDASGTLDGEK